MKTKIVAIIGLALLMVGCNNTSNKDEADATSEVQTTDTNATGKLDFPQTLSWENTSFEIKVEKTEDNTSLIIQPKGLEITNDSFSHDILGSTVANVEIADLDGDNHAEIFVYLSSDGSGSYGNVIAYSVNNGKSMSQIAYNLEGDTDEIKAGYMGHDSFSVKENKLERRFPIYKENDANANPTGGERLVQYKLVSGTDGKVLVVDTVK